MEPDFHRTRRLPPYVFAEVNRMKAKARAAGEDIIDFGMGNPDQPTPKHIVDKMIEAVQDPKTHRYLVSSKYDAIVLAPLDDKALVGPVKDAAAAGIPVVIVDSGLQAEAGKDFVSFVATDNYKGGQLAAQRMVKSLGGDAAKGRVLMLRYQEGSASTAQREQGFADEIAKAKGITFIDPKRYAGATRATAQEAAENLLASNADLQGVYCPNESSTFGMLLALRSRGLAGKVNFVGFDSSEGLVQAMTAGEIDGLVVQNPMRMGYLGVKTALDHLRGVKAEKSIDTGCALVTKENMGTPDMQELLAPDFKKYLGE